MISVTNLLCNYRLSGAVLGDKRPAFSWAVEGPRGGARVKWDCSDSGINVSLRLPEGTDAAVTVPTFTGGSLPPGFRPCLDGGYATGEVRGAWEWSSDKVVQARQQA